MREGNRRNLKWRTSQPTTTGAVLDFGISLHLGQMIYSNVGVPERLQFTVVGAAVNEVVRVQDLTKQLGCPLSVTKTFADAARPLAAPRRASVARS